MYVRTYIYSLFLPSERTPTYIHTHKTENSQHEKN